MIAEPTTASHPRGRVPIEHLFLVSSAEARQRVRRARWIAQEGLSASEAAHIPLDYDPDAFA